MLRFRKEKLVSLSLITSFLLIFSASLLMGSSGKGNMIGFIYGKDKITPVEGAILKLRNVDSGSEYTSEKANNLGIITLSNIEPGIYVAGINTEEGDFNFENMIGIKADSTAKISFSLIADKNAQVQIQPEEKKKRKGLIGFFTSFTGMAISTAATGATIFAVVKTKEKETEASPFTTR